MSDLAFPEARVSARRCFDQGNLDFARQIVESHLQRSPADPEALELAGHLAVHDKEFGRALEYFEHALQTSTGNDLKARCWNGLGHARTGRNELRPAAEAFRQAHALTPEALDYAINFAAALARIDQTELAIEILREAVRQHPQAPEPCVRLGNLLIQASRFESALVSFDAALKRSPDYAPAHFRASVALAVLGQTQMARAACQRAVELDPELDAYYQLAVLDGFQGDARRLASAEKRALGNQGETLTAQIDACFALAHLHDGTGNHDRAFAYLARGNRLKRSTLDFRIADEARRIDAIIARFTPEFIRRCSGCAQSRLQPIFIVGLPRSGSTLLEQMLAGHPAITPCGELDCMTGIARQVGAKWWTDNPSASPSDEEIIADINHAADSYAQALDATLEHGDRFTDKFLGNFLLLGLIHLMFPRAVLLHIRRHPMDTCFSCYQHLFTGYIPYAYDLAELGMYYGLYAKLMCHWRSVLPQNRILDVDYETLVSNPEHEIREVLAYCGLGFDAHCLQPDRVQRAVNTASHSQVRRPIYRTSVGRWQNYAAHLQPLQAALIGAGR